MLARRLSNEVFGAESAPPATPYQFSSVNARSTSTAPMASISSPPRPIAGGRPCVITAT